MRFMLGQFAKGAAQRGSQRLDEPPDLKIENSKLEKIKQKSRRCGTNYCTI